jgi:hypothetical protein
MKDIYISGKITGDPDYYEKFKAEEERLARLGYEPCNPAKKANSGYSWEWYMRLDIHMMVLCDGVALLPDWKESRGAQIEERLARELGIEVRPCAEWK